MWRGRRGEEGGGELGRIEVKVFDASTGIEPRPCRVTT